MKKLKRSKSAPAWLNFLYCEEALQSKKSDISQYQRNVEQVMDVFYGGVEVKSEQTLMDVFKPRMINYRIGDNLNCGRTGVVKTATSSVDGSMKAVKFMWQKDYKMTETSSFSPESPDGDGIRPYLRRSKREVNMLLKAQQCEGVIRLEDVFYVKDYSVLVMPLIRTTVHSFMLAYEKLPAQTLDELHSMEPYCMVHGDIKPENILITEDSKTLLIDFGSSDLLTAEDNSKEDAEDDVVVVCSFKGSLAYSPPECLSYLESVLDQDELRFQRVQGGHDTIISLSDNHGSSLVPKYSQRLSTDVWCLGMTGLEMLMGWTPFSIGSLFLSEDGQPLYKALELLKVTTDERFIDMLLEEAGKAGLLSHDSIMFLKKCLTVDPLKRVSIHDLLESDEFLNKNKFGLPQRLETAVRMTREQFLPPGLIHGVTPLKKSNKYVPTAFVIMQHALKRYNNDEYSTAFNNTSNLNSNNALLAAAAATIKSLVLPNKSIDQSQPEEDTQSEISIIIETSDEPTTSDEHNDAAKTSSLPSSSLSWTNRLFDLVIPLKQRTKTDDTENIEQSRPKNIITAMFGGWFKKTISSDTVAEVGRPSCIPVDTSLLFQQATSSCLVFNYKKTDAREVLTGPLNSPLQSPLQSSLNSPLSKSAPL